ncbi:MAG: hypothetical protein ACP5U1_08520 [Desulfomonilaceae bacterium]
MSAQEIFADRDRKLERARKTLDCVARLRREQSLGQHPGNVITFSAERNVDRLCWEATRRGTARPRPIEPIRKLMGAI